MQISLCMSFIALASAILQIVSGFYFSVGIFAAVVLPLCGYYGARHRNRFAISFFSFCNGLLAIMFIVAFASTRSSTDEFYDCVCSASCRAREGYSEADADRYCGNENKYRTLYWVAVGLAFFMVMLQFLGCLYGMRLLRTQHFVKQAAIPAGVPVVGTAAAQYPQNYGGGRVGGAGYPAAPNTAAAPMYPGYATNAAPPATYTSPTYQATQASMPPAGTAQYGYPATGYPAAGGAAYPPPPAAAYYPPPK
ncbi:MAG: hypothetical protein EOO41_02320 [Methanobacteriota archaeon]|nr:MAG: hypothetical protein EOO41_02320 [Euryarchaeota archaeon]